MSIFVPFNFPVHKETGKVKVEHHLPPEQDPYPSSPPRKKTATASDENVPKKQVENPNARKSWKDVDKEISGLQVSTDLLIGKFASDELPDLIIDESLNVTLGIAVDHLLFQHLEEKLFYHHNHQTCHLL